MKKLHRSDPATRGEVARNLAEELERSPAVSFAYLYGSFLEFDGFHDVDIGIYVRESERAGASRIALELARKLGGRIGYVVDVRILNDAPSTFLYHVLRGKLLICHDDQLLGRVMEQTVQRYLDISPILSRATVEAFQR